MSNQSPTSTLPTISSRRRPLDVAEVKQALRDEASALQAKATELEDEIQITQAALERITNAIASLEGTVGQKATSQSKRRKPSKPAASRAEVVDCLAAILRDKGALAPTELESLAKDELRHSGFSLLGFGLRFKESLAEERFVESPKGIQLVTTKEPRQRTKNEERRTKNVGQASSSSEELQSAD